MAADPDRFKAWFSAADLQSNRSGSLAIDQARRLGLQAKAQRAEFWVIGILFLVAAIAVAYFKITGGATFAPQVETGPALIAALVVGLIGVLLTASGFRGTFSRQVAGDSVEHLTGAANLERSERSAGRGSYAAFELRVGFGPTFDVDQQLFHAITAGEPLTAYYLAGANRLVNLESAAAPATSASAAAAPTASAAQAVAGPPDGPPLAQAIIGSWRMTAGGQMAGLAVTIEFRTDGTAVITPDLTDSAMLDAIPAAMRGAVGRLAQPRTVAYHWTDADHLSLEGQGQPSQVRLLGGQLIIEAKDGEQHLERLAAASATAEGTAS